MSKSIKPTNDLFWDSSAITHERQSLKDVLQLHLAQLYMEETGYVVGAETIIPFTESNVIGTYLKKSSNTRITVNNDNVVGILFSANMSIQTSSSTKTQGELIIKKNGENICRSRTGFVSGQYDIASTSISPFYIEATKGDYFEAFYIMRGSAGSIGVYKENIGVWFNCRAILK